MTGIYGQLARYIAGAVAVAVSTILVLHMSIVLAYAPGSGEAIAAAIAAVGVVAAVIAMWTVGRPSNLLGRTGICLAMAILYVATFVVIA